MGGVAGVGQIQLLQPFFTLLASAILLGETGGADRPRYSLFSCSERSSG
ncbi:MULTISPECIES: hypothetical protein [unclassified Microcoleus]|nr:MULTISPECIES: hypothetical protein [unclassified Microcoleus]MCC3582087.1 hypothetical protein [Microcoleus sp. PH2017_32_RDM_D_A]MCC3448487.1 hypothetical protein [Microcoleus sp. PH2017_09_SFU_O_A]MCC3488307.1 hypothetical protein [Microcoleus sp. PH2017_14_LAR_D_A]MCC3522903.1 hypothetical protein [Microcoleus sp. PH2017_20_SFW_D_A]MCC3569766.1 hypothetical protein [Microcoleus sp. PH2017_31_RDM_U_A]